MWVRTMLRCKKLPVRTGKKKPTPLLLDHPLTALIGRPFFVLNMLLLSVFGPVLLVALWQQVAACPLVQAGALRGHIEPKGPAVAA